MNDIIRRNDNQLSQVDTERLHAAGQAANRAASHNALLDYRQRKAANTIKAQDNDIDLFCAFMIEATGTAPDDMSTNVASWSFVTHGLLESFIQWQLEHGYAIGTINRRLATLRRYARIAAKAGFISADEISRIRDVSTFSHSEARQVDKERQEAGISTRLDHAQGMPIKKADNIRIPEGDVKRLKTDHDNTPQGRRDKLLMCLLLDLGLRASEAALLKVGDVDMERGEIAFYRPKVDKTQTHVMTADLVAAMRGYFNFGDASVMASEPLLRASKKDGELTSNGLSPRSISRIVRRLGDSIGIEGLSAHDCRHSWATRAANGNTSPFALQEAGGWNSLAMPRRYIDENKVANEGVNLSS